MSYNTMFDSQMKSIIKLTFRNAVFAGFLQGRFLFPAVRWPDTNKKAELPQR